MKVFKFYLILFFISNLLIAGTSVRNGENGLVLDDVEYLKSIKIESDLVKQTIKCAFVLPDGLKFRGNWFEIIDSNGTIVLEKSHNKSDMEKYEIIIKKFAMRFECKETIKKFNYLSELFEINIL